MLHEDAAAMTTARTLPRQQLPCGFRISQAHFPARMPASTAAITVVPPPRLSSASMLPGVCLGHSCFVLCSLNFRQLL